MMNFIDKYITGPISDFLGKNYVDPAKDQAVKSLDIGADNLWAICMGLIMFGLLIQAIGLKSQGRRLSGWGVICTILMFILRLSYGK